jgi:hypothetical protein
MALRLPSSRFARSKGDATLKKMQIALTLAPMAASVAAPAPVAQRKVKVALDRTTEGYQWRLEAPKDWKAELLSAHSKQ